MKIKYLFLALVALLAASCSEDTMDNINKDESDPAVGTIHANLMITDAILNTSYGTIDGDLAWYVSSYTEQEFGTGNNQLKNAELRNANETASSTTFNNEWNSTYSNMENLKQIIAKCSDGGLDAGALDMRGMAEAFMALNLGVMTDLFGDIPYSQALNGLDNTQPALDKQSDIYTKTIPALLDSALADITAAKAGDDGAFSDVSANDPLFAGDKAQWTGLVHALKARYLLHTLGRNPNVLSQVITEAQAAVDAGFDGAKLNVFNGVNKDNPWSAYWFSRYYVASSTTVSNLMNARNDSRVDVYDFNYSRISYYRKHGKFLSGETGIPGNAEMAMRTEDLNAPTWLDNGGAYMHIFSKSELYFILAEAKARTGQDATSDFATAVEASFADFAATDAYLGFSDDGVDYVASLDSIYKANPLKEIMVQKYLAMSRDEQIETYNDIRRCMYVDGASFVTLTNPNNNGSTGNLWPYRLPYGSSDVIANPNITSAFGTGNDAGKYIFTKKVWWAGGDN
jgi:hypothetical protein